MKTSTRTKSIVASIAALVAVAAIAPAGAGAVDFGSFVPSSAPQAASQSDQSAIVLHRDGSQATPFVADVSPQSAPHSAGPGDGFDWGDAAIGAGAGLLAAALLAGGSGALQARRRRPPTPAGMTSQGV